MKKIFSIILAAGMIMSIASCNKKAETQQSSKEIDSISMILGKLYGTQVAQQLKQDSSAKASEVLKGIKTATSIDTTKHGKVAGFGIGLQVMQMMQSIGMQYGSSMNQKMFIKNFTDALKSDSAMSENDMMKMQSRISIILDRVKEKNGKAMPLSKPQQNGAPAQEPEIDSTTNK